eukprot:gene12554-16836_t
MIDELSSPLQSPKSSFNSSLSHSIHHTHSQTSSQQISIQNSNKKTISQNSRPEEVKDDGNFQKNALFQTNYHSTWTLSDQYRLLAIDRLRSRTLEYHNNVHERDSEDIKDMRQSAEFDPIAGGSETAARIFYCSKTKSQQPTFVSFLNLDSAIHNYKSKVYSDIANINTSETSGLIWIHMMDLMVLPIIDEHFPLHMLVVTNFKDLRFHSSITHIPNGMMMSLCYYQMDHLHVDPQLFKLYCYIANGVIITYIAELMPETDPEMIKITATDEQSFANQKVCLSVLEKWENLYLPCAEIGPVYILYELCIETISCQDPLLEFFSRSLFYFKKKTTLVLKHRQRVEFMQKMHIVKSVLNLLKSNADKTLKLLVKLVSKVEYQHNDQITVNSNIFGSVQLPFLYDLQDSFQFVYECILTEIEEAVILHEAMDSVSQLRSNNTAMLLSLVATIFLPVTFFTGVFGMNFQVDGGYTIGMVNDPRGPFIFILMCIAVFILSFSFFISTGWIEVYPLFRQIFVLFCGKSFCRNAQSVDMLDARDSIAIAEESGNHAGLHAMSLTKNPVNENSSTNTGNNILRSSRPDPGMEWIIKRNRQKKIPKINNSAVDRRLANALEEDQRRLTEANIRRTMAQEHGYFSSRGRGSISVDSNTKR